MTTKPPQTIKQIAEGEPVRIVRGTATRWVVQQQVSRGRWKPVGVYPTEALATQKAAQLRAHLEQDNRG